jgi:hypothetical protein
VFLIWSYVQSVSKVKLIGKSGGNKRLTRPKIRWKGNIKIDCIYMVRDTIQRLALVNTVMNSRAS